jgi:hypothetical protein
VKLQTSDQGVYPLTPVTDALTRHHQTPAEPGARVTPGDVTMVSAAPAIAESEEIWW